jgi:hypothetical protein
MKLSATGSQFLKAEDDELRTNLADLVDQLSFIINGNIGIFDNVKLCTTSANFTTANTNLYVEHTLGRVPRGYIVIRRNGNILVYDGSLEWNQYGIYLKGSTTGRVTLLIF